jgi:hypothetical protein
VPFYVYGEGGEKVVKGDARDARGTPTGKKE